MGLFRSLSSPFDLIGFIGATNLCPVTRPEGLDILIQLPGECSQIETRVSWDTDRLRRG